MALETVKGWELLGQRFQWQNEQKHTLTMLCTSTCGPDNASVRLRILESEWVEIDGHGRGLKRVSRRMTWSEGALRKAPLLKLETRKLVAAFEAGVIERV